jgi:hypothetical protein
MDFGYTYAPNLIHQGASVITEISSANGYKNSASPNSYEVTHGPKLPQNHFQRVKNYTTSDKIKVRYEYIGRAHMHKTETQESRTCARCATVVAKSRAPEKRRIYESGRPPTHFWFSFQVDLTLKSGLDSTGWLVKDLEMP